MSQAHTRPIDGALNAALGIVTGCLRPTPMDHLPILSAIEPAELCHSRATLSLAKRGTLDPDHILHGRPAWSPEVRQERLKTRCPFVSAARKLLNELSKLGVRVAQRTNYRWSTEYSKSTFILRVFILGTSTRPLGMGLTRTFWVKLNRPRTGFGRFRSSMYKWGLALSLSLSMD